MVSAGVRCESVEEENVVERASHSALLSLHHHLHLHHHPVSWTLHSFPSRTSAPVRSELLLFLLNLSFLSRLLKPIKSHLVFLDCLLIISVLKYSDSWFLWLQCFDFVAGHVSVNNNVSIKRPYYYILYILDRPDGLHADRQSVHPQVCNRLLWDSAVCK